MIIHQLRRVMQIIQAIIKLMGLPKKVKALLVFMAILEIMLLLLAITTNNVVVVVFCIIMKMF